MAVTIITNAKLLTLLRNCLEQEVQILVDKLMGRFDEEIISYEDADDPARPSLCREEFELFLKENINFYTKISNGQVEVSIDDRKLGFEDELDDDTTDCIKIIATIMQGIHGEYVFVHESGRGRFNEGFLVPVSTYRAKAKQRGWDISKSIWRFSNFPGTPDFFVDVDLNEMVDKAIQRFTTTLEGIG